MASIYTKEIIEFIKVRLETTSSKTAIAREVMLKFNPPTNLEAVRFKVKSVYNQEQINKEQSPIKRLFFDIETSYNTVRLWRTGKVNYIDASNIIEPKKIICISYKWWQDDKVHTFTWDSKQSDRKMLKDFIKILGQADEIIGHNSDRFDIKEIRTRAILEGVLMFPRYRSLDTLKKARKYFNFESNRLDYLGKIFNVGRKLDHEGMQLWIDVVEGKSKKQLDKMVKYCEQDVLLLEDVFNVLSPYIDHNTNYAVQKGVKKCYCPECASKNVTLSHTDTTPMGYIKRNMKCLKCRKQYVISNKSYTDYLVNLHNKNSK